MHRQGRHSAARPRPLLHDLMRVAFGRPPARMSFTARLLPYTDIWHPKKYCGIPLKLIPRGSQNRHWGSKNRHRGSQNRGRGVLKGENIPKYSKSVTLGHESQERAAEGPVVDLKSPFEDWPRWTSEAQSRAFRHQHAPGITKKVSQKGYLEKVRMLEELLSGIDALRSRIY